MKVTVISPVMHDGKAIDVGAVVYLPKDVAQALLACGAAEEGDKGRAAKTEAEASAPESPPPADDAAPAAD